MNRERSLMMEKNAKIANGEDHPSSTPLKNQVALNQKMWKLEEENAHLAENVRELEAKVEEYSTLLQLETDPSQQQKMADQKEDDALSADGVKLLTAGWTVAKVQRLCLKYFRSESFRKALIYQKRYLTMTLDEREEEEEVEVEVEVEKEVRR